MLLIQHSKEIDVYFIHDVQQIHFDQWSREINLRYETKNDSRDLQN
jgi:hypothetical protein